MLDADGPVVTEHTKPSWLNDDQWVQMADCQADVSLLLQILGENYWNWLPQHMSIQEIAKMSNY